MVHAIRLICPLGGRWRDQRSPTGWDGTWILGSAVCSGWCLRVIGQWSGQDTLLYPLPFSFPLKIRIHWRQAGTVVFLALLYIVSGRQWVLTERLLKEWLNDRGRHLLSWHRGRRVFEPVGTLVLGFSPESLVLNVFSWNYRKILTKGRKQPCSLNMCADRQKEWQCSGGVYCVCR